MYNPISYLQTDARWKNVSYSNPDESTTIGRAGCGPTSAAMVVATVADKAITPVEVAEYARKNGYKYTGGGTSYSFFQNFLPKMYGIPCKQLNGSSVYGKADAQVHATALSWLKQGNWLIACMGPGNWTKGGHYILVYGYQNGYVYINDPASTSPTRLKAKWSVFINEVKYYWSIDLSCVLPPKNEFTKESAKPIEVMWLQSKIGAEVDSKWGQDTAKRVGNIRESFGWNRGNTYKCTKKLIDKLK